MITLHKKFVRSLAVTASVATVSLILAGCNTVSGMGTDIEQTSDNTKKAFGGTPDPAPGQSSNNTSATKK